MLLLGHQISRLYAKVICVSVLQGGLALTHFCSECLHLCSKHGVISEGDSLGFCVSRSLKRKLPVLQLDSNCRNRDPEELHVQPECDNDAKPLAWQRWPLLFAMP